MGIKLELTDDVITSHSGLAYIGKLLNDKKFFYAINRVSSIKKGSGFISDFDIIKTMIGLIAIGKPYFEAVEEYRDDPYFKSALGLKKVPSAVSLRQRIEQMPKGVKSVLRSFNQRLLSKIMEDETVEIGGKPFLRIDFDVTPMDNSDTQKEGVSPTYKKFEGYSPMMSYIGSSGYMLNNELREGSAHSNCEGSLEHFKETIEMALSLSDHPILVVIDSGNDDLENVKSFDSMERVHYIIKRNLRRESKKDWLEIAKKGAEKEVKIRDGLTKYYATVYREEEDEDSADGKRRLKIAIVAIEESIDKYGQYYLEPLISVETYWFKLDVSAEEVEQLYHVHGTSEQYHSEFKSDLDMERLPSGKFYANELIMLMGMIGFNLLRILGQRVLKSGKAPGRRGIRLRLRTVLQNLMYMGAYYFERSRKMFLRIFRGNKWALAFLQAYS